MEEYKHEALLWSEDLLGFSDGVRELTTSDRYQQLVAYLQDIASRDFPKLIAVLYRIDVSETKARQALADRNAETSVGKVLADLVIERLQQKLIFREKYRQDKNRNN